MNSRLLPQNKASFGSDQLAKFCRFVWKRVPTIRALSARMEGTIGTRRPRGNGGGQRGCFIVASPWLLHEWANTAFGGTSASERLPSPYSEPPKAFSLAHVALNVVVVVDHTKAVSSCEEKETRERKRSTTGKREKDVLGDERERG